MLHVSSQCEVNIRMLCVSVAAVTSLHYVIE